MAKAIIENSIAINIETRLYTDSNISSDEIVQASVDISGVCGVEYMETQNVYMSKLEEDLTEYCTRLFEMKARVVEVQDDMKEEYLLQVENLENTRNMFSVKYGKLEKSKGDAWDDLKVAIEEAWSELEFF